MSQKKFEITTLGCKVNQSESAGIAAKLRACGFDEGKGNTDTPADTGSTLQYCIINTCTVTEKASMQSRQAIRRAIRNNPGARIIVTGCYAQTQPDEIKKIEGVHEVVGHGDKQRIPTRLLAEMPHPPEIPSAEDPLFFSVAPDFSGRTRAFLKIQDGCDARCTYCIVPRARGKSRSMPVDQVLGNLAKLREAGYLEVVLSGIHLGCYGKDLATGTDLAGLLDLVLAQTDPLRFRLSSIEPRELTDEIISLAATSHRICNHFHIPLQSGDDGILKRMGRPYSRTYFQDLVLKIHDLLPEAAIGLDTLIGFPGETDAAFENTFQLVKSLPITYLHVFPFSPRKKTPAAKFPDPVPIGIVKERSRRMRELGVLKKKEFYSKFTGQTVTVLVEGKKDPKTGLLTGTTSNYMPVFLSNAEHFQNCMVEARIESLAGHRGVVGRVATTP